MVSKFHFKKSTIILFVLVLFALSSMGSALVQAAPPTAQATDVPCPLPDTHASSLITEYTIPTEKSGPSGITVGSDGALWYVPAYGQNIGRIATDGTFTEFPFPLAHDGDQHFAAPGPDGAIWFTDDWQNMIGRITSDGTITEFPIPSSVPDTDAKDVAYMTSLPRGLVTGSDGALWFSEAFANNIGRITVDGEVTEYPLPTAHSTPVGLALGSDGAVWFIEKDANKIGRITTDGTITEYPIPTPASVPLRITAGEDGALWFSEFNGNKIGRITTDGEFTEYALPSAGANPVGITAGFGVIWFTEYNGNKIGCITAEGEITEYQVPTAGSVPFSITAGSDGAVWFTESEGHKIGRLQVQATVESVTALTTFSPTTFILPITFHYDSEWSVEEEYSDVVTLRYAGHDAELAIINVKNAKIADSIPFPDDFVSWIQSPDSLFQVVESRPVLVSGFNGIQINATAACSNKAIWIMLSGTGWKCPNGEHIGFVYLADVHGERVLIQIQGSPSGEDYMFIVGESQKVLDTVVFTK